MTFRPRQPRVRDRAYLDWIKQLPCLACAVESGETAFGCDPAHIRHAFPGWTPVGMAEKPDDFRCVPLCRHHHDEQHSQNERAWWSRLGVDPVALCAQLQKDFPSAERGLLTIESTGQLARHRKLCLDPRSGGLSTPIEAAPEPVTVTAHRTGRRDDRGNVELIVMCAGEGRTLIDQRVYVTPESVRAG